MRLHIKSRYMDITVRKVVKYETQPMHPAYGTMRIELELEDHSKHTFYEVEFVLVTMDEEDEGEDEE